MRSNCASNTGKKVQHDFVEPGRILHIGHVPNAGQNDLMGIRNLLQGIRDHMGVRQIVLTDDGQRGHSDFV